MPHSLIVALIVICAVAAAFLLWLDALYEIMLNRKLVYFFDEKNIFTDKRAVEAFRTNEEYLKAQKWFDGVAKTTLNGKTDKAGETVAYEILQPSQCHKWAVLVHGYANTPRGISQIAKRYYEKGYNIIMPCLHGQGEDNHKYVSMGYYDKFVVRHWCRYIAFKDPQSQITLHGVSMGGATVLLATGEELPDNVKACVSDCAYATSKGVFTGFMKPFTFFLAEPIVSAVNTVSKIRNNFDMDECRPIEAVALSKTPTLFIHGSEDHFVSFDNMETLYEACAAEKEKFAVDGAPHSICSLIGGEEYWARVWAFTEETNGCEP